MIFETWVNFENGLKTWVNFSLKTLPTFSKLGRNSWVDPLVGIRMFDYFIFVRVVSFDPNPAHLTTNIS